MNLHNRIRKLEACAGSRPAQAAVERLTDEQRAQGIANIARQLASHGTTPEEALASLRQRTHEVYGEPSNEQAAWEEALDRRVGELLRADAMEQAP